MDIAYIWNSILSFVNDICTILGITKPIFSLIVILILCAFSRIVLWIFKMKQEQGKRINKLLLVVFSIMVLLVVFVFCVGFLGELQEVNDVSKPVETANPAINDISITSVKIQKDSIGVYRKTVFY